MAAPLVVTPGCCQVSCADVVVENVPGPAGANGANGANGTNGVNAFTTLTANFTMPASLATAVATVADSTWSTIGQIVFLESCGWLEVTAHTDGTHMTLKNLETATAYTSNVAPGTIIPPASTISPGGLQGPAGSAAGITLNSVSPTTTKGDLIVDNGANSPNASDVRLGVGTNGQLLSAVAAQPTGLMWQTLLLNAGTDNGVPRLNGAAGTPIPLQTSKVVIGDDGEIQASGSGGNARGTDAIDLQVTRGGATMVASGTNATISGGANNTASANYSTVGGGNGNTASGLNAFVGGGQNNTASVGSSAVCGGTTNVSSGLASGICAGDSNIAAGSHSFVGGGENNRAGGNHSSIAGGADALTDKYGQSSMAAGSFANFGDAQKSELVWRVSTTDATANVEMFLDGSAARATIPVDTSWHFDIMLVGRSSAGVDASWTAKGLIHNNGGTTAMTCAATIASVCDGTGGTWGVAGNFAVTADNANDSLKLAVTGAVATNVRWVAHGRIVEVSY